MPENRNCLTAFGESFPYQISTKNVEDSVGYMENLQKLDFFMD
jgi:hypothetical protein